MKKVVKKKPDKEKLPVFIIAFVGTLLLVCGGVYLFKDSDTFGGGFNAMMNVNMADGGGKKVTCASGCICDTYGKCLKCMTGYVYSGGKCIKQKKQQKQDLKNYKSKKVVADSTKKKFKVLVVEIDPILTKGSVAGVSCKGKNASVCLGQNKTQAINELVNDLEYSSHNYLDVEIYKTEKINEFPTYNYKVSLINGKKDYRLDQDTWLNIFKDGWYNGVTSQKVQNMGTWGTYNYEYIINKLNLVQRRNNKEFDEVWLVNVDPSYTYESIMVGRNAFWINGAPIEKNCSPFRIMNVSTARPDTNFECFGHATEQLLNNVFASTSWSGYNPLNWSNNSTSISTSNYSKLNLFQKFMLTEHENSMKGTGLSGVGNIHYSPNSGQDYDWDNKVTKVYSKYYEWNNYPNLTNTLSKKLFSPSIYINTRLNGTSSDARKHHRWWFGLLPHHSGYTNDGYYNNWWNYFASNKYVKSISSTQRSYQYNTSNKIDSIEFILRYSDGSVEVITVHKYDTNVIIDNKNLFNVDSSGNLYAKKSGQTTLKYYRDGVYGMVTITIK